MNILKRIWAWVFGTPPARPILLGDLVIDEVTPVHGTDGNVYTARFAGYPHHPVLFETSRPIDRSVYVVWLTYPDGSLASEYAARIVFGGQLQRYVNRARAAQARAKFDLPASGA